MNNPHFPWYIAMDLPGAGQMRYLRSLVESRPILDRVPDQQIITDELGANDHIQATRGKDYIFVFFAGKEIHGSHRKIAEVPSASFGTIQEMASERGTEDRKEGDKDLHLLRRVCHDCVWSWTMHRKATRTGQKNMQGFNRP